MNRREMLKTVAVAAIAPASFSQADKPRVCRYIGTNGLLHDPKNWHPPLRGSVTMTFVRKGGSENFTTKSVVIR